MFIYVYFVITSSKAVRTEAFIQRSVAPHQRAPKRQLLKIKKDILLVPHRRFSVRIHVPLHPLLIYGYDFFLTLFICVSTALQEGKLKLSPPQGCPSRVFKLMVRCWAASPKDRLSFSDIAAALSDLPSESKV